MKKILKLTFILFLVCAVTAGILGGVNELTYQRIAEQNRIKTVKAYSNVLPADDYETVDFAAAGVPASINKVVIDKVSRAADGSGYVVESTFSGAQGSITMAVGVDNDLLCTGISIIKHSETSGLGANAASAAEVGVNFRAQFVGEDAGIALTKAGGHIDALSGATITSRAVTTAVAASIEAVSMLG